MFGKTRRRIARGAFGDTARSTRELTERHSEISGQIETLESFICKAPARAAEIQLDRMETIPPPEVFDRMPTTESNEPRRLSRAQAALVRASRRRNMLVFLLSATAFAAFAHWLAQAI